MSKPIEESPNEPVARHNSVMLNCGDFRSSNPYSLWLSPWHPFGKPLYGLVEALHNADFILGIRENPRMKWVGNF